VAVALGGGVRGGDSASGMGCRCSAKDLATKQNAMEIVMENDKNPGNYI